MKQITTVLIFILSNVLLFSQNSIELKPVEKKHPVILISGNDYMLYKLDKRNPIEFLVEGADSLIISSRKRIDERDNFNPYSISYKFDNLGNNEYTSAVIKIDHNSVYVDKSVMNNPSTIFKKALLVPAGSKNLKLFTTKSGEEIDVSITAYYGKEKKKPKPNIESETILIKTGKQIHYYKLNSVIPTIVKADGEGKLIVYTRKRLSDNNTEGYTFTYTDKYSFTRTVKVDDVKVSKESIYKSFNILEQPSTYTKTVIEIPEKYGEIIFSSDNEIDARFVFQKGKDELKWKEIVPKNNIESVILYYKETNTFIKYNRISNKQTFSFDITGPKTIRLLVRGEFLYDMYSNDDYEIVLKEGTKVIQTYKLSCFRSSKTEYKDNDEMIPGTLDVLYITIPEGKHSYSFEINNVDKTALIRLSIPLKK
jgi:hypothetical protein